MLKDVFEPPGETPGGLYARRGEILIVRRVGEAGAYPVAVSHEDITDSSFGVKLDEIEVA